MPLLGVNIDHVATLRQARGTRYPSPIEAALVAVMAKLDIRYIVGNGTGFRRNRKRRFQHILSPY